MKYPPTSLVIPSSLTNLLPLSAAAELGALLGVLGFDVELDVLDFVVSAARIVLSVLLVLVDLAIIVIIILTALLVAVVVALAALLEVLAALVIVNSNIDTVLELGVTGDLLDGNDALVLLAVLVEVEVLLVLRALFLVGVESKVGDLVRPLLPVLVLDDQTLGLAVATAGTDLAVDLVVVALGALLELAEVSGVGSLGVVIGVLLALLLVLGARALVAAALGLKSNPDLGVVGTPVTAFDVPFVLLALVAMTFPAAAVLLVVITSVSLATTVVIIPLLAGVVVFTVLLRGLDVLVEAARGCDDTSGDEGQDSGDLIQLHVDCRKKGSEVGFVTKVC